MIALSFDFTGRDTRLLGGVKSRRRQDELGLSGGGHADEMLPTEYFYGADSATGLILPRQIVITRDFDARWFA